jgi:hypothetical protein
VHLFGFTIEIYHDARPYKRQKRSKHVAGLPHVCASLYLNISTFAGIYSDRKNYIIYFDGNLYLGRCREELTRSKPTCLRVRVRSQQETCRLTVRNISNGVDQSDDGSSWKCSTQERNAKRIQSISQKIGRRNAAWLISKRIEDKTKQIVKRTIQGLGPTFVAEDRNSVRLI